MARWWVGMLNPADAGADVGSEMRACRHAGCSLAGLRTQAALLLERNQSSQGHTELNLLADGHGRSCTTLIIHFNLLCSLPTASSAVDT
eukprot:1158669-Pelagomonas_calceolata.AAC.3